MIVVRGRNEFNDQSVKIRGPLGMLVSLSVYHICCSSLFNLHFPAPEPFGNGFVNWLKCVCYVNGFVTLFLWILIAV